jgi:hypothetical protein
MVNYSNGKIYKIETTLGDEIYVGSTTKKYLSQRMGNHRELYKLWKEGKVKVSKIRSYDIFDKYGVDNCYIVLIENVNCNCKDELKAREAHYIKTLQCVNKNLPGGTKADWNKTYYDKNKETINGYKKKWRSENIDKIHKKLAERTNCTCGKSYRHGDKWQHERTNYHVLNATVHVNK